MLGVEGVINGALDFAPSYHGIVHSFLLFAPDFFGPFFARLVENSEGHVFAVSVLWKFSEGLAVVAVRLAAG